MMERERGIDGEREREREKEWDGGEKKVKGGAVLEGEMVVVGGMETFLSYLWFHLTKEGSLFGSNYISFLPIVDKASHTMCGSMSVFVYLLYCLWAVCCGDGGLS